MDMKKRLTALLLLLSILLAVLSLSATGRPAPAVDANAYDLVAAVNALRASNGLPPLQMDGTLMAVANRMPIIRPQSVPGRIAVPTVPVRATALMRRALAMAQQSLSRRMWPRSAPAQVWTPCCTAFGRMRSTGTR